MVARWLQPKLAKMARMRRSGLKSYKTGGVDVIKMNAHDIYQNSNRVRSTKGPKHNQEPVLNGPFTQEIPQTFSLSMYNPEPYQECLICKFEITDESWGCKCKRGADKWGISRWLPTREVARGLKHSDKKLTEEKKHNEVAREQRSLIDTLYTVWQGTKHQGLKKFYEDVLVKRGDTFKLSLIFSGREFLFVQETETKRWVSKTYASRDLAMAKYNSQRVEWIAQEDK